MPYYVSIHSKWHSSTEPQFYLENDIDLCKWTRLPAADKNLPNEQVQWIVCVCVCVCVCVIIQILHQTLLNGETVKTHSFEIGSW